MNLWGQKAAQTEGETVGHCFDQSLFSFVVGSCKGGKGIWRDRRMSGIEGHDTEDTQRCESSHKESIKTFLKEGGREGRKPGL